MDGWMWMDVHGYGWMWMDVDGCGRMDSWKADGWIMTLLEGDLLFPDCMTPLDVMAHRTFGSTHAQERAGHATAERSRKHARSLKSELLTTTPLEHKPAKQVCAGRG